ncbi:MAG: nucleotidyltransferase family protein [Longicatena sp.]
MKVAGIICEYNPFHNGHRYHIKKTREISECDVLVCVMSGNFVQRGESAICDKWLRAKEAVLQGVDLVLELPFPWVVQSADYFAQGAITILQNAGVDTLVFGSECNDITYLKELASTRKEAYKQQQKDGISYAKAFSQVHSSIASNDILGVAYLKALEHTHIIPYTIQRTNTYLSTTMDASISSATAIRKGIKEGVDVSHTTSMSSLLNNEHDMSLYYPYIQTFLTTAPKAYLEQLFLMDEGIESHLIKQALRHFDWHSFLQGCTSKRYPTTSIQRTLIHVLTQTTKAEMNALPSPNYLHTLAFNNTGKAYLRELKANEALIASSFSQIPSPYRELEMRAARAYAYPLTPTKRKECLDGELQPPIYVDL